MNSASCTFNARAHIVESLLRRCSATAAGGAAYVRGARASMVLEGSVAEGNSAPYGGALVIDNGASCRHGNSHRQPL